MAITHPIIRVPDVGHEPHNPVRDDSKLAPTEDLDREPDGVPHKVVGLTALFSVMIAMLRSCFSRAVRLRGSQRCCLL